MSSHDVLDIADRIAERTERLAEQAVQASEQAARRFWISVGLQSEVQILAALARTHESVRQTIRELRETGLYNDNSSLKPGLAAYLTPEGKTIAEDTYPAPSPYHQFEPVEETPGVFKIELPFGGYIAGAGSVTLYGQAQIDASGNFIFHKKPVNLGYPSVVRVEGYSGELWQNWSLLPDGSPKPIVLQNPLTT